MSLKYTDSLENITSRMLSGFFAEWINGPSQETHFEILKNSTHVILAVDEEAGLVAGFITALSDNVLSAYLPLLEVHPDYRRRGVGGQLMRRMLDKLNGLYMIDLSCDEDMQTWYKSFGLKPGTCMMSRNYRMQQGRI